MEGKTIRVAIIKSEGSQLEVKLDFSHTLENMQEVVGGYIEAITIREDSIGRRITVWINEEGKLINLPPNFAIIDEESGRLLDVVMGDVLITSCDVEGEIVSLTDEELEFVRRSFNFTRGLISPVFCQKTLFI